MNGIAQAIAELSGLVREWIKSTPSRNMKNAIKNADKYIETNENFSMEDVEKQKRLTRYKKKFDKYKIG